MNIDMKILEEMFGATQVENRSEGIYGILHTKDYDKFIIVSDTGNKLIEFQGAKIANKCLSGDHVIWDGTKCNLELRDEHPLIVGTLELTNKSKYGITSRGVPIYLFTPYNKSYPQFIVGSAEKDFSKNKIALIKFDNWSSSSTFPRGLLQQIIGVSGDFKAETEALILQACPWKYPKFNYNPESKEKIYRQKIDGFTFNIDPKGCKDIDDVITINKIEDKWKVTITISDVATYVEDGSPVDIMASLIGQTLYNNEGKVIRPMLPYEYSEKMCSLSTGKDSFGISLECIWNGKEIEQINWFESIIKTDKSYTYEEFDKEESEYGKIIKEISSYIAKTETKNAHEYIEWLMIFYNNEAGKLLKDSKMGILRKHSTPEMEKLERYNKYIPDLQNLAFSSAEYCLAEEKETTHYGLSSNNYTHITSPIRRYADLINQRVLKLLLNKSNINYIVPISMFDMNLRQKNNKNFSRDYDFLCAVSGNNTFSGIILEKKKLENNEMKIKIYIPEWKRCISTRYKYLSDDIIISKDETRHINVNDFSKVTITCTFNLQLRNWKERAIINISN